MSADTAEAALAMANAWPLLERGGGIEVRELTQRKIDLTAPSGATTPPAAMSHP